SEGGKPAKSPEYFQPYADQGKSKEKDERQQEKGDPNSEGKGGEQKGQEKPDQKPGEDGKDKENKEGKQAPDELGNKQEPQPPAASRKIIRTGEIEFEIDSFQKTVDSIRGIIKNVSGAFIATVDSDKLANGKVRGSLIVRMP